MCCVTTGPTQGTEVRFCEERSEFWVPVPKTGGGGGFFFVWGALARGGV